jgi:hypothetical protein
METGHGAFPDKTAVIVNLPKSECIFLQKSFKHQSPCKNQSLESSSFVPEGFYIAVLADRLPNLPSSLVLTDLSGASGFQEESLPPPVFKY